MAKIFIFYCLTISKYNAQMHVIEYDAAVDLIKKLRCLKFFIPEMQNYGFIKSAIVFSLPQNVSYQNLSVDSVKRNLKHYLQQVDRF